MTTSDPSQLILTQDAAPNAGVAVPSFPGSLPAGLPDPLVIARMANELFSALPDSLSLPSQPGPVDLPQNFSPPDSPPATVPAARPEISLPSDGHFPGIPASVGPATVAPVSTQVQAAPPAVPGAIASTASEGASEAPVFSFLQDARPIFSDRQTPALSGPYPAARPLPEFSAPAAPGELPLDFVNASSAQAASPPTPAPPASFGAASPIPVPQFSFLEELRPLTSFPPSIPGPVPAAPKNDAPDYTLPFDLQIANDYGRAPEIAQLTGHGSFGFFDHMRPLDPPAPQQPREPLGIEQDVPRDLNLSSYPFDAETVKRDFPILRERVHGRPLVWLDNAATTQKPQSVIDRLSYFYEHENSNVHRAAHELAARATDAYESAREKVRRFVNAPSTDEIVFVRGTTEGINLIAQTWGRRNIQKDDEIVITWLEHHANIVPWQMLCAEKGAKLRVAPVDDTGQIILEEYEKLLCSKTRLVSITQVSNALGTVTPAQKMIEMAHRYGATVLLDGAQSVSHMRADVQALDCDFFVFSGHKVFGPTGIGVVYGKAEILEHMPPWQGGGNMIQDVTFEKTVYHGPPQRFEAGTGNIADAVGLGAAIDYLDRVGMHNVSRHEHALLVYATDELSRVPGLRIIGTAKEKAGVLSFTLEGFRTEQVGEHLNRNGIAVRSGHHCAQPILRRFGIETSVRASLALYNTFEDIDRLIEAVWNLRLGRTAIA
ncbi:cysteine desulfurase / selenocysteine lyase [Granulicella rosea]|uniref:Cysteine desulfurase n=1 Tax=Granulicella rosea TaxID=474952 RepID=A0A239K686_9BACT|nr:family 2A encapsulin nanocompartment cargo protein cysteine desulfurase [Granulicella rosea]SNT12684.1 cysteine desulfurase / selenocysteine lyase [Granulicella rosea]